MSSFDNRRKDFKKSIDAEECRRKRGEGTNFLRKNKRNEHLNKRRFMIEEEVQPSSTEATKEATTSDTGLPIHVDSLPQVKKIYEAAVGGVNASNFDELFMATKTVRRLLSRATTVPADEVLNANILQYLVGLLACSDFPKLQFEAAWALTNIGSTSHTNCLVDAGVIPALIPLLVVPTDELREQSVWCLGNIAGDNHTYRDMIIDSGAMEGLAANLKQPFGISMKRNTMWALSNLCRGKPYPNQDKINSLLPLLAEVVATEKDIDVLCDACWSLSYLTDGNNDRIQHVVNSGVVPSLVQAVAVHVADPNSARIVSPALRTLGNILTGSDVQTQSVLHAGFLRCLKDLVEHSKKSIRKEACWAASNVTAGTPAQIGSFLAMPGLPEAVVEALRNDSFDIQKEAQWTVANICTNGSDEHVQAIVERYEAISPLCALLNVHEVGVIKLSIEALSAILRVDCVRYGELVEECEGIDSLEALQEHENEEIYTMASKLIEDHFQLEDEEEEGMGLGLSGVDSENVNPTFSFADSSFGAKEGQPQAFCFNPSPATTSTPGACAPLASAGLPAPAVGDSTQRQLNFGNALQEKFVQ